MFSLVPRCHGLRGSQKYTGTPLAMVNRAWCAISLPWSHVSERRSCSGSSVILAASASTTTLAVWLFGRPTSIHEAAVTLDECGDRAGALPEDQIAFPVSGPAGSSASAGRSLIWTNARI